jgi:hypothetical protein
MDERIWRSRKMDANVNRDFSIVVTTILSLSILVMTAPVVAENTTGVDGAFFGTLMCDEEEDLTCKVTDLKTESFGTTFEGMPSSPATTAFTPDITIDISEESAPIGNFTDMYAVSSPDCRCDIRWFGQGVWSSKTSYYADDKIVCHVKIINYPHEDTYDCSYLLEGELYGPSGNRVKYVSAHNAIKKGNMQGYDCKFPAPATGWDSGGYKFCCTVTPTFCDAIEKCCTFRVLPLPPDLVITSLWSDDSTIYYKIKNTGDKTAGASNTSLTVDGVLMALDSVSSLGSGATATGSFNYTWNCTNTNDTIEVCADYTDDVDEYSDSNNCRAETWTCPDLMITDVWFVNNTIIYYKITNNGDKTAGTSSTSLTVDGVFKALDSVASLEHGAERTESFNYTWNCTNPSDMIEVCADYTDGVAEGNETNNCRTETLACPPDIWVNPTSFDVTLPPDVVSNYTLTLGNDGTGALEFDVYSSDVADSHVTSQTGWPETTGDDVCSSPALGDIDGDGDIEVVVGSDDNKVYAWHHDGSNVHGWPKTTGDDVCSSPALGDIDGDGDIEVVIGSEDDKVYAWHHDGSTVTGWPETTDGIYWYSSTALGDIDGNGDTEVVIGSSTGYDGKVYAWHHDGSTVTGWPKKVGGSVYSSPALGDIDGDGGIEVVIGSSTGYDGEVYAWHHDGSTVTGWPTTTGIAVSSSPALGDIDGDGDIEVVVGSWDAKVYAWHHDGSNVTGWPKKVGGSVYSSPALGDIDGDGDVEVVVGSFNREVHAWHHDGSNVTGWPKKTDMVGVCSSPALGDIDGDGDIEVVIGSRDGKVYVWDCSGHYDPNNIEWGTFHHDVRHTGLYEAMPSKKIDWLSEYPTTGTVDPGSQTDITVTLNTTGLPFGKYAANITITSNDPDENPVTIPVRLTVTSTPAQKGDLNHDGTLTPADAAIALRIAATGAQNPAADVSGDDRVTALDALMILQAAAGRIEL